MSLAIALLLTVVVCHYSYDVICAIVPALAGQAKGVFYILRGLEGVVLFVTIWFLRPILWPVCLWGAIEEGETAVCRAAAGFPGVPTPPTWTGLCDSVTGVPAYMLGVVVAAVLVTRIRHDHRT